MSESQEAGIMPGSTEPKTLYEFVFGIVSNGFEYEGKCTYCKAPTREDGSGNGHSDGCLWAEASRVLRLTEPPVAAHGITEGWRLLNDGEMILKTDEFYRPGTGTWVGAFGGRGGLDGEIWKTGYLPVRRLLGGVGQGEPYKANGLWPHEEGSVEQAAYEFANGKTIEYETLWFGILVARIQAKVAADAPREWDAETIKDAPDGLYTYHMDKLKRDPAIQLFTKRGVAELLDWYSKTQCPECFAFGPIPQPEARSQATGEAGK